jgi:transcriptional regulator with XRE-family HTH domain
MTETEKTSQNTDSNSLRPKHSGEEDRPFTSLISRESLIRRLIRGVDARSRFVESHLDKSIAYQIRALRGDKWTQAEFAEKVGINHANNVAARLENPRYGKHTLTTLKKIATAFDVGLVVWFVPFGRLVDWASGVPYLDKGLTPSFYDVPSFTQEFELASVPLDKKPVQSACDDEFDSAREYAQGRDPYRDKADDNAYRAAQNPREIA